MRDLFVEWRRRADVFSHRAVITYTQELPDYRRFLADPRVRAEMVDFGVFVRERTVTLVADGTTFTGDDLAVMVASGRERGAAGISPVSHQRALHLHTALTLDEVRQSARSHDVGALMHTLRALPLLAGPSRAAFTRGFLAGQRTNLPVAERVRTLVDLLLAGDELAADLATDLGMDVPARCVVLVVRTPGAPAGHADPPRAEIVAELLSRHWLPLSWPVREEFVALVGADGVRSAHDRALAVAQDLGQLVELPCAVGAEEGDDLAAALAQAREVCRAAPLDTAPGTVYYRTDLFAELGIARVPPVDHWLRGVAHQLVGGPRLVTTLAAFYRNRMSRTLTAAELGVHPRTLDYRLRRVHELTGLDPVSVRGVRILSTAVTRQLSGAWE